MLPEHYQESTTISLTSFFAIKKINNLNTSCPAVTDTSYYGVLKPYKLLKNSNWLLCLIYGKFIHDEVYFMNWNNGFWLPAWFEKNNSLFSCMIYTVSILGRDKGYKVKYNSLSEGVPKGEARGNSWRQRVIFDRISQVES